MGMVWNQGVRLLEKKNSYFFHFLTIKSFIKLWNPKKKKKKSVHIKVVGKKNRPICHILKLCNLIWLTFLNICDKDIYGSSLPNYNWTWIGSSQNSYTIYLLCMRNTCTLTYFIQLSSRICTQPPYLCLSNYNK